MSLLLLPLLFLCTPLQEEAAQAESSTEQAAVEEAPEPSLAEIPSTLEAALSIEPDDLAEAAAPLEEAQLRTLTAGWMQWLAQQQDALEEANAAQEGSKEREAASSLGSDRDALITRVEVLLATLAEKGGDVGALRARIESIRVAETRELDSISTVPSDQAKAQELRIEVLKAQLRPLRKEQVKKQLDQWMDLLQRKCLEVRKVEVAAMQSADPEEIARYNERAVALRQERGRLIERTRIVMDALKRKDGDVDEARAYLSSIVIAPPVTGWTAAVSTGQAWLLSPDGGLALARKIGVATLIMVLAVFIGKFVSSLVRRAFSSMRRSSELLKTFMVNSVRKLILFIGALVAFDQMGANLGPLLAAIGAAGLVVGLALQGTLSNFASGLMIMFYRPFDVKDTIEAGGTKGVVEGMTLVTTRIRTFDNQAVIVPNNKIWGDVIINVTAKPTRRVDMVFGISYDDDIARAREILLDILEKQEGTLADPPPVVEVFQLGDSSVNFIVRPWAATADYWKVYWSVTRTVKERFDQEGVSIPYPQRDVHVIGKEDVHVIGKELEPTAS